MHEDAEIIEVDELRKITDLLFHHLQDVAGGTLRIKAEYFWAIDQNERYEPYTRPSNLSIGQISECIENLRRLNESNAISYGLVWLSSILLAIGEQIVE